MMILRDLRNQRKLSQRDIAEFLGITQQAYANYENGNREPDLQTLKKLADYFGVLTDFLLEDNAQLPSDIVDEQAQALYEKRKVLFDKSAKASPKDMDYIINLVDRLTGGE